MPCNNNYPQYMSATEAALYIGIKRSTAYELKKILPFYKIKGIVSCHFKKEDIDNLMELNKIEPFATKNTSFRERIESSVKAKKEQECRG